MESLSQERCHGSQVDSENCSWYHGAWQYLRLLDVVSAPTWHDSFYRKELEHAAHSYPSPRVLVCGVADYSMLYYVLEEFTSKRVDITVLDLCKTPLELCQWCAWNQKRNIQVVQGDLLAHAGNYDVIVTDAFLTRFDSTSKKQVIEKWRQLLAPGGTLITTVRIANGSEGKTVSTGEQVNEFTGRALDASGALSAFPTSPENIALKAREYAKRIVSYPASAANIESDIKAAGFTISRFGLRKLEGEMEPTSYAEIVAIKEEYHGKA